MSVSAAWNPKRPLEVAAPCGAELVILRDDFPEATCPGRTVLTGADFAEGGSAELFRSATETGRCAGRRTFGAGGPGPGART